MDLRILQESIVLGSSKENKTVEIKSVSDNSKENKTVAIKSVSDNNSTVIFPRRSPKMIAKTTTSCQGDHETSNYGDGKHKEGSTVFQLHVEGTRRNFYLPGFRGSFIYGNTSEKYNGYSTSLDVTTSRDCS